MSLAASASAEALRVYEPASAACDRDIVSLQPIHPSVHPLIHPSIPLRQHTSTRPLNGGPTDGGAVASLARL